MLVQGIPILYILNSIIVIMKLTFTVFMCIVKDILEHINNSL